MAACVGALGISMEKMGFYTFGDAPRSRIHNASRGRWP